jgi:hypothetical protein
MRVKNNKIIITYKGPFKVLSIIFNIQTKTKPQKYFKNECISIEIQFYINILIFPLLITALKMQRFETYCKTILMYSDNIR